MQEFFLKLWVNRSQLTTVENPAAWLNTVLSNTTSNYIRSKLRYELRVTNLLDPSTEDGDMLGELDARFTQNLIDQAVTKLPVKRKMVYLLSRRDGLSRSEIATRLHISENTVRNQLAEALQFIEDYIRQKGRTTVPVLILLDILSENSF